MNEKEAKWLRKTSNLVKGKEVALILIYINESIHTTISKACSTALGLREFAADTTQTIMG